MKILQIESIPVEASTVRLIADSAWHPDRRPLFIPNGQWRCQLRPAIRIERLGKAIATKFAGRYYSDFAIVNLLLPADEAGMYEAVNSIIDDAMVLGNWVHITDESVSLCINGSERTLAFDRDDLARAIADLSAYATFKTGDIIVLPEVLLDYVPTEDMHINVTCAGDSLIDFSIK